MKIILTFLLCNRLNLHIYLYIYIYILLTITRFRYLFQVWFQNRRAKWRRQEKMEQAQFRLHENSLGLLTRPPNALDHLLPPLIPGLQHHPSLHHSPHLAGNINGLPGFLAAHHSHHTGYSSYLTPPTSSPLSSGHHSLSSGPIFTSCMSPGTITGSISSASIAAGVAAVAAAGLAVGSISGGHQQQSQQQQPHRQLPSTSHPSFPPSPPILNDTRHSPSGGEDDFRSTSIVALRLKAREHLEVLEKASTMV